MIELKRFENEQEKAAQVFKTVMGETEIQVNLEESSSVHLEYILTARDLIKFFNCLPKECLDWEICFGGAEVRYINVDTEYGAFSLDDVAVFDEDYDDTWPFNNEDDEDFEDDTDEEINSSHVLDVLTIISDTSKSK